MSCQPYNEMLKCSQTNEYNNTAASGVKDGVIVCADISVCISDEMREYEI